MTMESPEYPPLRQYRQEIQATEFKMQFRGYSPQEVDAFMDRMLELLGHLEAQIDELQRYDTWLRVEAHSQVVGQAQQKARQLLQQAQDKSRELTESARADMARERQGFDDELRKYTKEWNEQKEALEQELFELRRYVKAYRAQSARALEETLGAIKRDQQRDDQESGGHAVPPLPAIAEKEEPWKLDELLREFGDRRRQLDSI